MKTTPHPMLTPPEGWPENEPPILTCEGMPWADVRVTWQQHYTIRPVVPQPDRDHAFRGLVMDFAGRCREDTTGKRNIWYQRHERRLGRHRLCAPRAVVGARLEDLKAEAILAGTTDGPEARAFVEALISGELADALTLKVADGVVVEVVHLPHTLRDASNSLGRELRKAITESRQARATFEHMVLGSQTLAVEVTKRLSMPDMGAWRLQHRISAHGLCSRRQRLLNVMRREMQERQKLGEAPWGMSVLETYHHYRSRLEARDLHQAEHLARTLA